MSDPKRLRDTEAHPALRAALDASDVDAAPPETEASLLAALGLGPVAKAAAAAAAAKAGVTAATTTTAAATTTTATATSVAILKWGVATVVLGAAIGAGVVASRAPTAPTPPTRVAFTSPAVPEPTTNATGKRIAPPVVDPPAESANVVSQPAPQADTPPRPARAAATPSSSAPPASEARAELTPAPSAAASTLSDELALLAEANAAVRRHDAAAATSALDRHDNRFPQGSLAVEAEALRVETIALTDPARARTLATAFLARHPTSPVSPRIRKIAEATP